MIRKIAGTLATAALAAGLLLTASPAHAATVPGARDWQAAAALNWAEREAGCWYSYGGMSCSPGFDCSGLVVAAYAHAGIRLPRTTYEMLASPLLHRTYYPHRGDLAFYGSGHVEFVTVWANVTYGALDWGTRVGWHAESPWWHASMYFWVS